MFKDENKKITEIIELKLTKIYWNILKYLRKTYYFKR